MRFLPASLFGRTILVLAAGLLIAQGASLLLNLFDRSSAVYRLSAFQIAARIGQAARILNKLPAEQRPLLVEQIYGRHLTVTLSDKRVQVATGFAEHAPYEQAFKESLQRQIGSPWPVTVEITPVARTRRAFGEGTVATPFEIWVARHFYFLLPGTFSLVAQVGLEDGTVAVFHANMPQEPLSRLESLVPRLLLLVTVCFAIAAVLVVMLNRSLARLALAADSMGKGPDGPPLEERGPSEIRRVIAAFNRMQARVRGQMKEREQLLRAISHDLKTPITRLRLRAEMLSDAEARDKMLRDLADMESMVGSTLEFFHTLDKDTHRQPVDVTALVESICEDRREAGEDVSASGSAASPYSANPQALRRALENLIGNAVRYGGKASITIHEGPAALGISVRDTGPGIPEEDLERVFEPYYRVENSRNRASGGTGLGLSIARNIARWHGGDIRLANGPDGAGLVAVLSLPR